MEEGVMEMAYWNPKKALVHLSLSAAVKGLGLVPEDALGGASRSPRRISTSQWPGISCSNYSVRSNGAAVS